ncbi:MAG: GxxExxY protein [Bacteroidia bacterium]
MNFDPLTYKIIGCAMAVHRNLGPGFQEVIYQRALALEFDKAGIGYERELSHPVLYDGEHIGDRRADFVVEARIVIEIKALVRIEDVHLAQAKNYTVIFDYPNGMLINFGAKSLEHKLLFNPKYS